MNDQPLFFNYSLCLCHVRLCAKFDIAYGHVQKASPVDYSQYLPNAKPNELSTKYGLPSNVDYCNRISNQRPNSSVEFNIVSLVKNTIHFDEDGVCDACNASKGKASIDWKERENQLRELCDRYRRDDGQ